MANINILRSVMDSSVVTGGSWLSSLPAVNLLNQQPRKVARSVGLSESATTVTFDLGSPTLLSMFALIATNLSVGSMWRIVVADNDDFEDPSLDIQLPGRPSDVVWGSLPWGVLPWNGLLGKDPPGGPITFYKHPTTVLGRYVRIDISDPGNPAGYVQVGRFMAGDAFSPQRNMSMGVEIGIVDESRKSYSVGNQVYSDRKPPRRRIACNFEVIAESEAFGQIYDLMLEVGVSGVVLIVYDPEDNEAILPRRTIYAQLSELSPVVAVRHDPMISHTWRLAALEVV